MPRSSRSFEIYRKIREIFQLSSDSSHGVNQQVQLELKEDIRQKKEDFLSLGRELDQWEIMSMEQMGNRCSDWSKIKVSDDFHPESYINNTLIGANYLGFQQGVIKIGGREIACGVKNSTLKHCHVESSVSIQQVNWMESIFFSSGSRCWNVGVFEHKERFWMQHFELSVGSEVNGRVLTVFPEMDPRQAELMLKFSEEKPELPHSQIHFSIVSNHVEIENVKCIQHVYLGSGTIVQGASELKHVTTLSELDEPVFIGTNVSVIRSILQWGCKCDRGAQLERAFLFEYSSVDQNGMMSDSCLGSNSHVAKGEITACFVGPFVGMHHQSLLIGTIWPEGKGNVGYGANVGSNHTGRAPDQEFWAGEGEFFGLSSSIKFPAYHREASYSIIATGVTLPPSKLELPFSLITPSSNEDGDVHGELELIPAWMLTSNRYSLVRSAWKIRTRNKSKRYTFESNYLNRRSVLAILKALDFLESLPNQPIIHKSDLDLLPGIFIKQANVNKAIEVYRECLELFFSKADLENPENLVLFDQSKLTSVPDLERISVLKQKELDLAIFSFQKDRIRGKQMTPDYDHYHPLAESDPCLMELKKEIEKTSQI